MTKPRPPGLTLTRPRAIKEAGQTLLGGLFLPVARLATTTLGWGAAVLGVAEIVKTFRPEDTAEEAGWRLVYAGLERAIDEIVQPFRHRAAAAKPLPIEHLMQLGGGGIDLESIEAPADFLDQPKTLPILAAIAPILQGALTHLGVEPPAARSAADRLPGYFVLALEQTWRDHKAGLAAISDLGRSPFALAARQERQWPWYRAWLEHELDQPLFAGDFSLRQLYQPLRGYWIERQDMPYGAVRETRHLVDLATAFDGWLDQFDPTDALRVVTGGPGSGKTSFVKWWAAGVLRRDPLLPTFILPLHRLASFDLEQEVASQARLLGFAKNPLDLDGGERRLLLILDGLDELEADHKTGREAASALITRVDRLLLERNRQGHQLRIVIAGRELIVGALRGELDRARQIFHVLGYLPRTDVWQGADDLLAKDQRQAWWVDWGKLTGETLDDAPASIRENDKLADLSDQPLLNHLLAITRAARPDALEQASSINTVYAGMLDHVWERSWGEKRQLPKLRPLAKDDFQHLFESIGLAVWQHGGGRGTTLGAVAEIVRQENLGEQLHSLEAGARTGTLDLLTAFYFRREGAADTFELTHKSFGEYFAALRLARLAATLHRQASDPEFAESDGLRRWYRWTHAARITPEIIGFLQGELRALAQGEVHARRATLIRLFDRNLGAGMALMGGDGVQPPRHFREAQRFDAAAELALLAAIGACGAVLIEGTEERPIEERRRLVQWSPAWPDRGQEGRTSAWDLLRRLEAGSARDPIVRQCMTGIDLDSQILRTDLAEASWVLASARSSDLTGANLSRATLFRANLSRATLTDANLTGANLTRANLSRANLFHANLFRANLSRANLTGANLSRATLTDADLTGANLNGANLTGADLFRATLFRANLSRANLTGADLTGANLCRATLTDADLCRATLTDADLCRATLTDADLTDADLTGANLTGANLTGANLSRATLTDADLTGANLIGANLTGANLTGAILQHVRNLTRPQLAAARNVDKATVPRDLPEA